MTLPAEPAAEPMLIELAGEELHVAVRSIDTGRVRIATRVHHEPVERRVALARTSARIDRVAADRIEDAMPLPRREGDVTIIPLFEEILVVRYRVTGEVHVREERSVEEHVARDTLRRTDIEVERLPPVAGGTAEAFTSGRQP